MPDWLARGAAHVMEERPPWESDLPLDALAAAAFPKLVISGRHSPVFEPVCDVLAERIGAERATASGRGHSIPVVGAPYNALLEDFLDLGAPDASGGLRCARGGGAGPVSVRRSSTSSISSVYGTIAPARPPVAIVAVSAPSSARRRRTIPSTWPAKP